ncbi:MAG: response regulator [Kouleothrix sp.]|jgi:DNA-binding NarL/FixJ family response regulator|nr:response regulator [Kouleothrix sp.]
MQPPHILIVDNDPTAALVTQHGLQRLLTHDADVAIAASAEEARARCGHDQIDLLIIDPSFENSPASTLVKELYARRSAIPVLVLTAYDTPRLRSQMRALGVKHYLAKPVELGDLGESVRLVVRDYLPPTPYVGIHHD